MLNNCAGGMTPWGTWLTCEENINGYFWGKPAAGQPEASHLKRYGIPGERYAWGKFHDRFDLAKEPNEANRFGWVVEIDPIDPNSVPKKRTALGRFKHEGAARSSTRTAGSSSIQRRRRALRLCLPLRHGGQGPTRNDRAANKDILDKGTLSVANFNADGTVEWLPLVHGTGP